jgi:dephospho-CoA kinase
VEAALILECGREGDYDVIVVVDAELEKCVDRVVSERGFAHEDVKRIAESQMRSELKIAKADFVIQNDGSTEELKEEAVRVYKELKKLTEKEINR